MDYKESLFIFRRDFRLEDNTGLIRALQNSNHVIPCFIYDEALLKRFRNSRFRLDFINESLYDLNQQLKDKNSSLQIFCGDPPRIVNEIIRGNSDIGAVFVNADITSYSERRDKEIHRICKSGNVKFYSFIDSLLCNPNDIRTETGTPYTVYTPFHKKARRLPVREPMKNKYRNYFTQTISNASIEDVTSACVGRKNSGLDILKNLGEFADYNKTRDILELCKTTGLSAHNRFGTVSIRETYHAIVKKLGASHALLGQLYWREFFSHILFHFPWAQKRTFKVRFRNIPWSESNFEAWSAGRTGFPIVDAGMRQLNCTGFMHNRARMITASFLTKDLHIDWRRGERYFAEKLIDYDPAVNSGNWQWAASVGCDAVPYFRIFNPWIQQRKFDSKCNYIKTWVPELSDIAPEIIHNLWCNFPDDLDYVMPILDHSVESHIAKQMFKSCMTGS